MPLIKSALKTKLKSYFEELSRQEEPDLDGNADKLATIIDDYIKSAVVETTVATTGSAAAQTGKGTGTLK